MRRTSRNVSALVGAIGVLTLAAAGIVGWQAWSRSPAPLAAQPVPPAAPAVAADDARLVSLTTPRPVPLLTFMNGDNRPMTLADFHGAVLLNLWATWCVPCRKEMPALDRLQAKMGGPDFQVVALSIDREGVGVVELFYGQLGIKSLGIYVDPSFRAMTAIGTPGLPTTLLIDRAGNEIARRLGAAEWDSPAMMAQIRDLLRQHAAVSGGHP
ncbi:MAG TPA: TlpA disulfide reductase family protein [Stellaceae bacterium]|nr:TlpA disulfide reductase family protein [Stellaceae bacterium]